MNDTRDIDPAALALLAELESQGCRLVLENGRACLASGRLSRAQDGAFRHWRAELTLVLHWREERP